MDSQKPPTVRPGTAGTPASHRSKPLHSATQRPASAFSFDATSTLRHRTSGSSSGKLSGVFRHSLKDIEAAATAEMSKQFHSKLTDRCSSAPLRRQQRDGEHDNLTEALMRAEMSRPASSAGFAAAPIATRPASAASVLQDAAPDVVWGRSTSPMEGRVGSAMSTSRTTTARLRGHPTRSLTDSTSPIQAYDDVALAALDHVFTKASEKLTLDDVKDEVRYTIEEKEGFSCRDKKERYNLYVKRLMDKLQGHLPLATFAKGILDECNRYIVHLERKADVGEVEIVKETMATITSELNHAKTELEEANAKVSDLSAMVTDLKKANDAYSESQGQLEKYIEELRVALSTYTSASVSGIDQVTPDEAGVSPYIDAIRRMSQEIEMLRVENVKLGESGMAQLDAYQAQSHEMVALLDRANEFQQQTGSLKATVRVMKEYIDKMETRIRYLEDTHSAEISGSFATKIARIERGSASQQQRLPNAAAFVFLQQKGKIEYLRPERAITTVMPDSPAVPALDKNYLSWSASCPSHLRLKDEKAVANAKLAFRCMNTTEVQMFITDALSHYMALVQPRAGEGAFAPFDEFLLDYSGKRYGQEKMRLEHVHTIDALCDKHFSQRGIDFHWFHRLAHGRTPTGSLVHAPIALENIRAALRELPGASKKAKDKIPRSEFLRVVKDRLPLSTASDIEALALVTIAAQEKFSEDLTYEPYFDKATPQAQLVHDQLMRLILENDDALHAKLENHVMSKLKRAHDEAAAVEKKKRDEMGVSGAGTHSHALLPVPESEDLDAPFSMTLAEMESCIMDVDPHCRKVNMINRLMAASDCPDLHKWYQNEPSLMKAQDNISVQMDTSHLAEGMLRRIRERCFMLQALPLGPEEFDIFPPPPPDAEDAATA